MPKQKTNKSVMKRIKITSGGKILRKHQFGSGHLKRHKSKNALNSQKKTIVFFRGEANKLRRLIGL